MRELWVSSSYELHLLSLPFGLAPTALLFVIAYAAVMRGAPGLRGWLLLHCVCLLPYAFVVAMSPSIVDARVASTWFRLAAAFIPLAAAAGTAFQLTLIRRFDRYRVWVWVGVASASAWIVVSPTNLAIGGMQHVEAGLWFPTAGPLALIALVHTMLLSVGGFIALGRVALTSKPSDERRQLRLALLANAVTYSGLVDVGLAYGVGIVPLGWLLSGIGSLLVVRALVVEDLLRVRAVDTTAPLLVLHLAGAILLGWLILALLGEGVPWWVSAVALCASFAAVRSSIATVGLVGRRGRSDEGPLERLLAQLVTRSRGEVDAASITALAIDVIELGIGVRPRIAIGGALPAEPAVTRWLAAQHEAVFAGDTDRLPADVREPIVRLVVDGQARAIMPVAAADELLALIVVPTEAPALRGRALTFVERAAERLAEALLHARMAQRAAERAKLAREVELAATVQAELLPKTAPHVHGEVTVVGSWLPATRCAGDFWGVYPLGEDRVLVTIGDVTGHGVASAMVTAAAAGASDVCVRTSGAALDLRELALALDAAVRRVGGGELAMTWFGAIIDAPARTITFVSCGHAAPYLCRAKDERVELHALVARGNPLGVGAPAAPRLLQRPLHAGDLVVCYTDGVTEAQDPTGTPFGDRRLQQLLKRLDRARLDAAAVHDLVQHSVATHRGGRPRADDETVLVAQLGAA